MLIIDGLTKRFRLPGWRVAWIIGPKEFIKASVLPSPPPSSSNLNSHQRPDDVVYVLN